MTDPFRNILPYPAFCDEVSWETIIEIANCIKLRHIVVKCSIISVIKINYFAAGNIACYLTLCTLGNISTDDVFFAFFFKKCFIILPT